MDFCFVLFCFVLFCACCYHSHLISGSSSSLHYSDVFVITRSQTLHDDVKDEDGRVTSPASGIVQGLRDSGFPVRVLNANITDRDKWEKGVADTALARYDQVTCQSCLISVRELSFSPSALV